MDAEKTRWTLQDRVTERIYEGRSWKPSPELFGEYVCDMYDFDTHNYIHLIDNSRTRIDLVKGLRELSPLADDALEVAELMDDKNFYEFKIALAYERTQVLDSKMPDRYLPLVLPKRFVTALPLTEKFAVALGVALIKIKEQEDEPINY